MNNQNNWKKKAVSLGMAVTMTFMGGHVLLGCSSPTYQDKVNEQEDDDNTSYHGNGVSPFIFANSGKSTSSTNFDSSKLSSSSWKSWTSSGSHSSSSIHASSYSGTHATSVSS